MQVVQPKSPILEENHFYSYGLKIAAISSKAAGAIQNRYLYQGDFSEYDEETGYNEFDLRHYDAQIGRWTTTDPYEQFASPYLGMGNSPGGMVDPDGGSIFGILSSDAPWLWQQTVDGAAGFVIGAAIGAATSNGKYWLEGGIAGAGATLIGGNWNAIGGALGDAGNWVGGLFSSTSGSYLYSIFQRSFAPWEKFGSLFGTVYGGDNRNFSLEENASSRIWGVAQVDISNGTLIGAPQRGAGITTSYDLRGIQTGEALAKTSFNIAGPRLSGNVTSLHTYLSGSNPLVAFSSPIVWNANIDIANNISNGYIDVAFGVYGKGFPAFESFIKDSKGHKAFLNVFQARDKSYAIQSLLGTPLTTGSRTSIRFYTNKRGIFTGRLFFNGRNYSLSQWNSWIQSIPAAVDK